MRAYFIALLSIVLLASCSGPKIIRTLTYDLACDNCGKTPDDILNIEINRHSFDGGFMVLYITNNSDETVSLDEKMFAVAYNDTVVFSPIGTTDVYSTYSYSATSESAVSSLYRGDYYSSYKWEDPLFKSMATKIGRTETVNYKNPDVFVIPPKSIRLYNIMDYIWLKKQRIYYWNSRRKDNEWITKWDLVLSELKAMNGQNLRVSVCYKKVSEDKWHSAFIDAKPKNMDLRQDIEKE